MSTTRKVNPLIQAINSEIRSERDTARSLLQRSKTLQQQRMLLRAKYGSAFKTLDDETSYVNVYFWSSTKPTFSITLYRLDGFKDPRLTGLLSTFLQWTDTVTEEVDAGNYSKTYNLELDEVLVQVHARIRKDSDTCERVQVGTSIQEVPVYELRCN